MIEIKNLTKKFDSNVALNRMNCYISEGTIFGLAGSKWKEYVIKDIIRCL